MSDSLKQFLLDVQKAFFSQDYDSLSKSMSMPLVVYSAAGLVSIKDRAALKALCDRYLDLLSVFPRAYSECTIVDRENAENNRFRTTVRWIERDANGDYLTGSLIRYFLFESGPGVLRIEMMEYLELAVSVEDAERIIH